MFPSERWARAWILGVGCYWGLFPILVLATRHGVAAVAPLAVVAFSGALFANITWWRWMVNNRHSLSTFLAAFFAGVNFPCQIAGAFRVAGWDWRKGAPVLVAFLIVGIGVAIFA